MNLTLSSFSHDAIDPELQTYVRDKAQSLGKYLDLSNRNTTVAVQLGKSHGNDRNADDLYRAEIHVRAPGVDQYVSKTNADQYAAFDEARSEMAHTLGKAKDKRVSMVRRSRSLMRKMLNRFNK